MDSSPRISRKVVLIGKDSVGKTSLMRQWLDMGLVEVGSTEAVGLRVFKLTQYFQGKSIDLVVWDIEQMKLLKALPHYYLFDAHALLFVSSLDQPDTYQDWEEQKAFFQPWATKAQMLWIANKADLLSAEARESVLSKYPFAPQVFCSAKSKEGLEELFHLLLDQITPQE